MDNSSTDGTLETARRIADRAVTAGPERSALAKEGREAVQRALQRLPETYRGVTVLRYWHDLSYLEIAATLGLTEATVKTRLHRARKLLEVALTEQGGTNAWDAETSLS